jgi:hypothetical protein
MNIAPMAPDYWEDQANLEKLAGESLAYGSALLCLGAGVSRFAGLPTWSELLEKVAKFAGFSDAQLSGLAQIENLFDRGQQILTEGFKGNRAAFLGTVRSCLYSDSRVLNGADAFSNRGMQALSFLCSRSLRGGCANVITYNFDDLLQRIFSYNGSVHRTVDEPFFVTSRADVTIFHPHGILQASDQGNNRCRAVITRDDLNDPSYAHWSKTLFQQFSTQFPLLIGLSGSDEALIRALELAKKRHPHIQLWKWPYYGIAVGIGNMNTNALESAGIKVLRFQGPDDWPQFVGNVCRHASHNFGKLA